MSNFSFKVFFRFTLAVLFICLAFSCRSSRQRGIEPNESTPEVVSTATPIVVASPTPLSQIAAVSAGGDVSATVDIEPSNYDGVISLVLFFSSPFAFYLFAYFIGGVIMRRYYK